MGKIFYTRCVDCGREEKLYLGVGRSVERARQAYREDVLAGRWGEFVRLVAEDHPEGWFDTERVVQWCPCGGWGIGRRGDFVLPDRRLATVHRCPRCKKRMSRELTEQAPGPAPLKCRACGGALEPLRFGGLWD